MTADESSFLETVDGLLRGDFSRLDPLFLANPRSPEQPSRFMEWFQKGYFKGHTSALIEAFTCACFNGRTDVARYLLDHGVDPASASGTGLNAFHWAANRGQLETVKLLIDRKAPLEDRSMYDGTVLGTAVWSAIHEPKADHIRIIEALIGAGARLDSAGYPSGDARVDEVLRRHGAVER
jgi:hypothetical protein